MDASAMVNKIVVVSLSVLALWIGGAVIARKDPRVAQRPSTAQDKAGRQDPCSCGERRERYQPAPRIALSADQRTDVAKTFENLLHAYTNGQYTAMRTVMETIPAVVTNMPERDFSEAVNPLRTALKSRFLFADDLQPFAGADDFEAFARLNLDVIRFLGDIYIRRGGNSRLPLVSESQTLKQFMRWKDLFHQQNDLDGERVADTFIAEWVGQIESDNGFTRRYMRFQVNLQRSLVQEGKMTLDELSHYVKSYADGLIRLGYTPKWLSEFDDLSKAAKSDGNVATQDVGVSK